MLTRRELLIGAIAAGAPMHVGLRKKILVFIGEPIDPTGMTVDQLVAEGRRRLASLLPTYKDPRGPRLLRKRLTNLL